MGDSVTQGTVLCALALRTVPCVVLNSTEGQNRVLRTRNRFLQMYTSVCARMRVHTKKCVRMRK